MDFEISASEYIENVPWSHKGRKDQNCAGMFHKKRLTVPICQYLFSFRPTYHGQSFVHFYLE